MSIDQAIFRLHEGLPRHAPGSASTTIKALRRFGRLPRNLRAIDLGCGNGAATRVLAKRLKKPLVAVDAHQPFLDELSAALLVDELDQVVQPYHADFTALDEGIGKFDLLWAEGSAYVLGFEQALLHWRSLLSSRGRAAISELSYLTPQPSAEAKEYWSSVYPGISTIVGNCAAAERTGYSVIDTMPFSRKDTKAYYGPIKSRIAGLRAAGEPSAELCAVIAEMEQEIEAADRFAEEVGYVFYLLEVQGGSDTIEDDASFDLFGDSVECDSEEDEEEEEPAPTAIARRTHLRGASSVVGERSFDVSVAPSHALPYKKLERQLFDLIGELGLERASRILDEVQSRIDTVVARGR